MTKFSNLKTPKVGPHGYDPVELYDYIREAISEGAMPHQVAVMLNIPTSRASYFMRGGLGVLERRARNASERLSMAKAVDKLTSKPAPNEIRVAMSEAELRDYETLRQVGKYTLAEAVFSILRQRLEKEGPRHE